MKGSLSIVRGDAISHIGSSEMCASCYVWQNVDRTSLAATET